MAILLAVAAALGWGASDYFGGDASRGDTPVFGVVAIAELLGVVLLAPVLAARGAPPPADPRLLLAALAGVAVTVELGLIYRALSRGQAFITAPTGGLGAAAAVTVGVIGGDPLSLAVAVGLGFALLGSGISAWSSPGAGPRDRAAVWRAAATCAAAAVAVAVMLSSLHAAGRLDPYWVIATEHASTGVSAGLAAAIGTRRPSRILDWRAQLPALALIAVVGVGGDLAYAGASRTGALSIVSAISSLYPVATIALGRLLQGHRATHVQVVGIGFALGGAAVLGAAAG